MSGGHGDFALVLAVMGGDGREEDYATPEQIATVDQTVIACRLVVVIQMNALEVSFLLLLFFFCFFN